MIQIKIYDHTHAPLTAFNVGEFGGLTYRKTLKQIGDCSFTLDINNVKVTEPNMRSYNHAEVTIDGVIQWAGYIVAKQITFNQVTVQCKEKIGILGKRLVSDGYTLSGPAGTAVGTLLSYINGIEDTGITMGTTDVTDSINQTWNQQDALTVLQNIADAVGAQFVLNEDGTLDFKYTVGEDRTTGSDKVKLEYNILQPSQANLLKFNVSDNGENICTQSFGKATALTSVQNDPALIAKFGTIEKFNSFSSANTQPVLDGLTASQLRDTLYSPTLDLVPGEDDNFDIGDLVLVDIQNKLVSLDDSFQILEKSVKIVNSSQKSITVKINQLPQDIVDDIASLQKKVSALETS